MSDQKPDHEGAKRIWLVIERASSANEHRDVKPGDAGGSFGLVEGACPGCKAEPFHIRTTPLIIVGHDTAKYGARCLTCNDPVGWVYATFDTIFGLEEDARMLDKDHQRARVYR